MKHAKGCWNPCVCDVNWSQTACSPNLPIFLHCIPHCDILQLWQVLDFFSQRRFHSVNQFFSAKSQCNKWIEGYIIFKIEIWLTFTFISYPINAGHISLEGVCKVWKFTSHRCLVLLSTPRILATFLSQTRKTQPRTCAPKPENRDVQKLPFLG